MKRIIGLISAIAVLCLTTGCNQSIGIGNLSFKHVHFSDTINSYCGTVQSWHDNTTGVEVKTKEYGSLFLSEGTYMLISAQENCPYCKKGE